MRTSSFSPKVFVISCLSLMATCGVNAQITYSFTTAAQCRDAAERKQEQCKQAYDNYRQVSNSCAKGRTDQFLACTASASNAHEQCLRDRENISSACNRLQMAEDSRARQERVRIEQEERQRETQRQIQLNQQQRQRAWEAEARQLEMNRANAVRQQELSQQATQRQAIAAAQTRTNKSIATGNAVIGMLNSLLPPSPTESVSDVYESTDLLKEPLQRYAMPKGSPAPVIQDAALEVLKRQQQDIERELKETLAEMQRIGNELSSAGATGTGYRAATSLPVNTGTANPWADTAVKPPSNSPPSTSHASSDNPWADNTAAASDKSVAANDVAATNTANPWIEAPAANSRPSRCDEIRAGRIKFKWAWTDQPGRRCFSNAATRPTTTTGATCCAW